MRKVEYSDIYSTWRKGDVAKVLLEITPPLGEECRIRVIYALYHRMSPWQSLPYWLLIRKVYCFESTWLRWLRGARRVLHEDKGDRPAHR